MKRTFLGIALFVITLVLPIQSAEALSCRQVADLNEQLRVAALKDFGFGMNSKESIAFLVKVYQAIQKNSTCVSSARALEVKSTIKTVQSACKTKKPSDAGYQKWIGQRDYWAGLYGKNFKFACSIWGKV